MASKFQAITKKKMEDEGYLVLKIMRMTTNGWPDLMCLKDGKVVWIECKEKNDTLKELQKFRIKELIQNGFDAKCLQDGKGQIYPIL